MTIKSSEVSGLKLQFACHLFLSLGALMNVQIFQANLIFLRPARFLGNRAIETFKVRKKLCFENFETIMFKLRRLVEAKQLVN